jgi:Lon protease-like protein
MVRDALAGDSRFGMVYHDWDLQGPFLSEEGRIGCVAEILEHEFLEDGRSLIVVDGIERFRIEDGIESDALYFEGLDTTFGDDEVLPQTELIERRLRTIVLFDQIAASMDNPPAVRTRVDARQEVSFLLAQTIQVDPRWHQELVDLRDEPSRLDRLDGVFRALLA